MTAGRRGSFSKGVAFGGLTFVSTAVLGVVSSIVVARLYGIDVVGRFALAYAPTGVVWFLSSTQEQPALIRKITVLPPRAPEVTGVFAAVFAFSSALSLAAATLVGVGAALLFAGPIDHPHLLAPALVSLLGYVVLTNPCWNLDSLFVAFRAGPQLFRFRLHQALVYVAMVIAAYFIWPTVWGLILATVFSWLTPLVHRLIVVRHWITVRVSREELRQGFRSLPEILRLGLKLTPGILAQGASNEMGTWILGALGSVASVGAYNRAWTLGRRLLDLNWRLTELLFPTLVERRAEGDQAAFDRALVDSFRYVSAIMLLPAAVGGGAALGVTSLFGPGFARGAGAFALLLLIPVAVAMTDVMYHLLVAEGRPGATVYGYAVRLLATIPATLFLSQAWGITGTAAGMVIGAALQVAVQGWNIRRYLSSLPSLWPPRQIVAMLLAYGGAFVASRAVDRSVGGVPGLFVALTAGTVAYLALFLALGGVLARDRDRVRAVSALLRARRSLKRA